MCGITHAGLRFGGAMRADAHATFNAATASDSVVARFLPASGRSSTPGSVESDRERTRTVHWQLRPGVVKDARQRCPDFGSSCRRPPAFASALQKSILVVVGQFALACRGAVDGLPMPVDGDAAKFENGCRISLGPEKLTLPQGECELNDVQSIVVTNIGSDVCVLSTVSAMSLDVDVAVWSGAKWLDPVSAGTAAALDEALHLPVGAVLKLRLAFHGSKSAAGGHFVLGAASGAVGATQVVPVPSLSCLHVDASSRLTAWSKPGGADSGLTVRFRNCGQTVLTAEAPVVESLIRKAGGDFLLGSATLDQLLDIGSSPWSGLQFVQPGSHLLVAAKYLGASNENLISPDTVVIRVKTNGCGQATAQLSGWTVMQVCPEAKLTVAKDSLPVGSKHALDAKGSTAAPGKTITQFKWTDKGDFPPGTLSPVGPSLETATLPCEVTGSQEVCLHVVDSDGVKSCLPHCALLQCGP